MKKHPKLVTTIVGVGLLAALLFVGESRGQTPQAAPQVLITWKAATYAPRGFAGKLLPTASSPITASVEVIDRGQPVDLSQQAIYWYSNNRFIYGGRGAQTVNFTAPDEAPTAVNLRVEIPGYSSIMRAVSIPIVRPEAVIETPFSGYNLKGASAMLSGTPYFFNAAVSSQLSYEWRVNGIPASPADSPETLRVAISPSTASGAGLRVSLTISNALNAAEAAVKTLNLTYMQ